MAARRIGVLAVQGGFAPHARALAALGHDVALVRAPGDLAGLDGLALPGGESTAQLRLLARAGLEGPLGEVVRAGLPVLATCAGLILAARRVRSPEQPSYGWIDVVVERNAYGRQQESFEATADGGGAAFLFIRAPRIVEVGPAVEVLATVAGDPVLVRQAGVTAATFHPELGADLELHRTVFGAL